MNGAHICFSGPASIGENVAAILVDFHAEASSEKMALGHFADGRVSAVFGTHCHVPTADRQILPGGTAYQTDAGMCGDYDSVIGMQKEPAVRRFWVRTPEMALQVLILNSIMDTSKFPARTGRRIFIQRQRQLSIRTSIIVLSLHIRQWQRQISSSFRIIWEPCA